MVPCADRFEQLGDFKDYYTEVRAPTRLSGLTWGMISRPGSPAKLASKAAECRVLQPFALRLVTQTLEKDPSPDVRSSSSMPCRP